MAELNISMCFNSVTKLKSWLEEKNFECGSPEAFCDWLQQYFEDGNEICVHGENYDYWACLELV